MSRKRLFSGCVITAVVLLVIAAAVVVISRRSLESNRVPDGYDGSPQRGRQLMAKYGCNACHSIPGVPPPGLVGPPLEHMGSRSYIAGQFRNERLDMEQWLQHPQSMKPGTAMPDLNVTPADARDMATYLATLK